MHWLSNNTVSSSSSFSSAVFCPSLTFTSFTTTFSFSVENPDRASHSSNVLMFFLAPNSSTRSLLHSAHAIKNGSIFAVELSVSKSFKAENGKLITVMIEIKLKKGWMRFNIWVGKSGVEIKKPILTEIYHFKHFVEHIMCMGFASSKKNSSEAHVIKRWNFSSSIHRKKFHIASRVSLLEKKAPIPSCHSARNSLGFLLGTAVLALACASLKRWNKERLKKKLLKNFQHFDFELIQAAANRFSQDTLIHRGKNSSVYRIELPNAFTTYAVKRFNQDSEGRRCYKRELMAVARIRHESILELRGWSDSHQDDELLVYDFIPNRTLGQVLESPEGEPLTWTQRLSIAIRIASALRYLHDDCKPAVIHGDVHSNNILLNENFEPKLADFAFSLSHWTHRVLDLRPATAAPENRTGGFLDAKADAYSYGVLLLEICGGRRSKYGARGFVAVARRMRAENRLLMLADVRLAAMGRGYNEEEMVRLLLLGLACTRRRKRTRPRMERVLQILNRDA